MDARYQGPTLGRFLSEDSNFLIAGAPDWVVGNAKNDPGFRTLKSFVQTNNVSYLGNPQNLNPYSYVSNNPLRYVDPSGKDYMDYGGSFAIPFYGVPVGPTAGYINNYNGDDLVFIGVAVAAKPGGSWSATYNRGEAAPGLSINGSGFLPLDAGVGPGIQFGFGQGSNGTFNRSFERGFGTPGLSFSATIAFSPNRALNFLGGNFQYVSTPPTSGINQGNIGKLPGGYISSGGGSVNISQLSQSVVSYASSPGADYTSSSFISALQAINLYNSPWMAQTSQSTPITKK